MANGFSVRLPVRMLGAILLGAAAVCPGAAQAEPEVLNIPDVPNFAVGWESYRRLDRLPYLGVGVQTLQYSSFDRGGGNDDGAGGCLRDGGVGCVVAEDRGPGEIDSIWFTKDGGDVTALGNIRIELDGSTVVDAPLQSVVDGALGAPFVFPLVANVVQSPGGVYIKVPMPYRESMRISVAPDLQYYHVTYRHFPDAEAVTTFDPADRAEDVLAVLQAAGTRDPKPVVPGARARAGAVDVPANAEVPIAWATGPGSVTALRLRLPVETSVAALRLRIGFDGRESVDAPLAEFFGVGLGPAVAVRSLMFAADAEPGGWFSAWWPMPFGRGVEVALVNTTDDAIHDVGTEVVIAPDPQWGPALESGVAGYFTTRSFAGPTTPGQDWPFVDEVGHGKFVGVAHSMSGRRIEPFPGDLRPHFLEGDERVYIDGSPVPQLYGTGTEDFYEGGWFFDHGTRYSLPLTGQPSVRTTDDRCRDYCVTAYRLMLAEAVDYRSSLRFGIEHGPANDEQAEYGSVAFLYTQT
ncbi:glycoside hydrolase family 172 protein [Nocardia sp. NPDC057440]|uniref:glycoside hydrolase family 172 protein n=1 Tax=Nocardia sp. NPDC057440 TaxID=3346134 RepID=UPI003672FC2C